MEFKNWLELHEGKKGREGIGSKILALGIPMASAIGGAALGSTLGPAGILPSLLGANYLAIRGVQRYLPQSTLELMKKK